MTFSRTICWRALLCGLLTGSSLLQTGCLWHTHAVKQVLGPKTVQTATLDELIARVNQQDEAIQSLTMSVTITASVGGSRAGKVTDYTSLSGYILLQKPDKLRILGLVPVLHNKAFDMASSGDTFKLLIPAKGKMITGSNLVGKPSANALENLRPYVFTQSLLVAAIPASDFTYISAVTHVDAGDKARQMVERMDYDLGVLHRNGDTNQLLPSRIIHFDRQDLLPHEQDIYDAKGSIETQAYYSDYRMFNGVQFPATVRITRPQEEYEITLTVEKLTENTKIGDDQFQLATPEGVQVQRLP